jgi:two-component system NarL family response regulator
MITVVLADDEPRFRRVVTAVLDGEPDIEVVGQVSDGSAAVAMAEEILPDLVLLDVRMPGIGGVEAANQIRRVVPTTKVVMLTSSDEEDDVYAALKAGAGGYLLKDGLVSELADGVRVVAHELGMLLSPAVASRLLAEFKDGPKQPSEPSLTDRELEVLKLVSRGSGNQEIADELSLSGHTVKRHVANIMATLHQRNRLEAVMYALRTGLLEPDSTN